jgi:glycosyltransferase involved in cell wall biosynthesis
MSVRPNPKGRIVMFTHDRQIDRRILLEADALQDDGWEVRIVALATSGPTLSDDPRVRRVGYTEGEPGKRSLLMSVYVALKRVVPVNSALMRIMRSIAWRIVSGGPGTFFRQVFADAVREEVADLYVAHDLPMLPVGVAAVERHGGRLVYDSHELFPEQEFNAVERRIWSRLESELIHYPDLVITVNASIAREMERRYGLEQVEVIHNAERLPSLLSHERVLHQRLDLHRDARVLLYQGGLSEGRNIDVLVRMLPYLRSNDVHLVTLGDGVFREKLMRLSQRLEVGGRVHLLPAVPQNELLAYTASADAGIIPYQPNCLNNRFCTPNKLFEFIAASVPVIATDLPELRRIVCGNGIGLVGDTSSPDSVAAMVDALFCNADAYKKFQAAVAQARLHINWDVESRHLLNLYRKLGSDPQPYRRNSVPESQAGPVTDHLGAS